MGISYNICNFGLNNFCGSSSDSRNFHSYRRVQVNTTTTIIHITTIYIIIIKNNNNNNKNNDDDDDDKAAATEPATITTTKTANSDHLTCVIF